MRLSEFIPQEVDLLKKEHDGSGFAEKTERRLKDLLGSEGDAELDNELVAIVLNQGIKIYDYSKISQKVYWTIFNACMEVVYESNAQTKG